MNQITVSTILGMKNSKKIVMITAYDALFSRLIAPHADILLVGDSLAMSFGGDGDTLGITLEQMIYHTNAVTKGAPGSFVVTDMPFGSDATQHSALKSAIKIYKESDAAAVKIEGGADKAHIISHLTQNQIAVMGHVGLKPQSVRAQGGYRVFGKNEQECEQLIKDALAVEAAGAFAVVLEGVKPDAAAAVTKALRIPTIGIGAGVGCDGQVLVWSDMLGFFTKFSPKFVRKYMDGATLVQEALKQFADDVRSRDFPNEKESY